MKGMETDPELLAWLKQPKAPEKTTTTRSPSKHREHNHHPQGKTGYDPKLARLAKHDKPKKVER